MQYVGVGRRLVAALVDGLIVLGGLGFAVAALVDGLVVFGGLGFAAAAVTSSASSSREGIGFHFEGIAALALLALWFVYYVVMEATLGATFGKLLVGVRVRTPAGEPIGWGAALVRNLLRLVDGSFGGLVGAVLIWTSARRQRLGDLAARTVVVQPS
jgi:uncharacterized RDD family membrane protein YckC